jgi:DNA repair exonuclease SbcCD nuclease subunit
MGEFVKFIDSIKEYKKYYILGNHDYASAARLEYHALIPLKNRSNDFIVVDAPLTVKDLTFVPFLKDLSSFPKNTERICIAHQTFLGADYGFMRPEDGVDPQSVSAEIIISGHIHRRQEFDKVIYPGTPYAFSASDVDQPKGLMLFNTDTYERQFIESPFPTWRSVVFVAENSIKELETEINKLNPSDVVVLTISGTRSRINEVLSSTTYKKLCSQRSISLRTDVKSATVAINSITAKSFFDLLDSYLQNGYRGSHSKEAIKERINSYVERYRSIRAAKSR